VTPEQQKLLRAPFPPERISQIPRKTKSGATVRLDYVGHADVTDRLLAVDPGWTWEPAGVDAEGLPVIDDGLWIKLTVCGVTRYGFGDAQGKTGGDAVKEMIGDAIRNAAMRFGVALDLWSKSEKPAAPKPSDTEWILDLQKRAEAATTRDELRRIFLEVNDGAKAGRCSTSEATDLRSFVNNLAAVLPEPVEGVVV
jgi:hypothetical protein